jgi:hypothetical protein
MSQILRITRGVRMYVGRSADNRVQRARLGSLMEANATPARSVRRGVGDPTPVDNMRRRLGLPETADSGRFRPKPGAIWGIPDHAGVASLILTISSGCARAKSWSTSLNAMTSACCCISAGARPGRKDEINGLKGFGPKNASVRAWAYGLEPTDLGLWISARRR